MICCADIVSRVRNVENPPFRPELLPGSCHETLAEIFHMSLEEDPAKRPEFQTIRSLIKQMSK